MKREPDDVRKSSADSTVSRPRYGLDVADEAIGMYPRTMSWGDDGSCLIGFPELVVKGPLVMFCIEPRWVTSQVFPAKGRPEEEDGSAEKLV